MRRARFLALPGAAGLAAAATSSARAQARTAIVVSTTTPSDTLPFFYARDHGMFERAGIDITTQISPSGANSLVALVGGAVEVGYVNTLSLSEAHVKGIPVEAIAPGGEYNTNRPHAKLLVLPDSPIKTARDLEGKVVSVTGLHDLLAVSVKAWLDKNGADPNDVRFVELSAPAMYAAMTEHRVDAIAVYNPFMAAAEANGARDLGKPYDAIATSFLTAAWCANANWVAAHRPAALAFAKVIHDAAAYTNPHYNDLIPFIAAFSKTEVATLEKMQPVLVPPAVTAADIQPLIDVSAKYKELATAFPARDEIFTP
jgi:NitT/TauT family transport system substrate-binding protein